VCGIAGVVRIRGDEPVDPLVVERMLDAIAHRGPDGRGVAALGCAALGAVRLAVRDPSERGAQPMATPDGRHHLVHNGELYDLADLRTLIRSPLRSGTDTEVLLHLLAERGEPTWAQVNGMFATAWWDSLDQRLVLARDRFGEKPLVWAEHDGCLWFASEEKALFAAGVPAEMDQEAWPELLLFRYVAGERTPYLGVRRLLPGHLLEVRDGQVTTRPWHRPAPTRDGDLRELLARAVRRRLDADVPLGLFLSGGIDSSSVAALAVDAAGRSLPAFTVAYPGHHNDEVQHARAVARHLGVDLQEVVVDPSEVPALLEEATRLRDEPMAQAAAGHILALARMARERVTVVLSGEGADELLGGYGHHRPHRYPRLSTLGGLLLRPLHPSGRGRTLVARTGRSRDRRVVLGDAANGRLVDPSTAPLAYRDEVVAAAHGAHPLRQALAYDQHTYLASVLATGDRSTMGAGLESRAPFLDPEVADLAAGLAPSELFARGQGKAPLRRAMADRLPREIVRRRKAGWTAPWSAYLREVPALRERVRALPTHPVLDGAPVDRRIIDAAVRAHLDGHPGGFGIVWALVRISLWHDVCVRQERGVLA